MKKQLRNWNQIIFSKQSISQSKWMGSPDSNYFSKEYRLYDIQIFGFTWHGEHQHHAMPDTFLLLNYRFLSIIKSLKSSWGSVQLRRVTICCCCQLISTLIVVNEENIFSESQLNKHLIFAKWISLIIRWPLWPFIASISDAKNYFFIVVSN